YERFSSLVFPSYELLSHSK
ncbi:hypothetical protein CP02DC22_0185B, partial [Chlamydia psittaci 02DC22]